MKQILLTALFLLATLTVTAQKTAADAFTTAPTGIFHLRGPDTRHGLGDADDSGLATPSANRLQGRSAITSLTPATITVKITDSSSAQIALLPAGRDTIFAVISTVATPGLDSTIKFYDSNWAPLPTDRHFTAPGWNDWMTPGHDITEITAHTPFMLASYFIDTDAGTLTATNNLATFLDEDTYKTLSPALRPTLTYKWNGKRFTK